MIKFWYMFFSRHRIPGHRGSENHSPLESLTTFIIFTPASLRTNCDPLHTQRSHPIGCHRLDTHPAMLHRQRAHMRIKYGNFSIRRRSPGQNGKINFIGIGACARTSRKWFWNKSLEYLPARRSVCGGPRGDEAGGGRDVRVGCAFDWRPTMAHGHTHMDTCIASTNDRTLSPAMVYEVSTHPHTHTHMYELSLGHCVIGPTRRGELAGVWCEQHASPPDVAYFRFGRYTHTRTHTYMWHH